MRKKTYLSPFPAVNVKSRSENVETDTVYCDAPEIDDDSKCTQVLVGAKTLLTDFYGMKSDEQFVNSLEDNIRQMGATYKLTSAQSKI